MRRCRQVEYLLNTGNLASNNSLDLSQATGFTVVAEKLNFFRRARLHAHAGCRALCLQWTVDSCLQSATQVALLGDCACVLGLVHKEFLGLRLADPDLTRMCCPAPQVHLALPGNPQGRLLRAAAHHGRAQAAARVLGVRAADTLITLLGRAGLTCFRFPGCTIDSCCFTAISPGLM